MIRFIELLNDEHRLGKTGILTTHDPVLAEKAERIICLVDGVVRECGRDAR